MNAETQPRRLSVRKWEVVYARLLAPVWLAGVVLSFISAVRGWGLDRPDAVVASALLPAMAIFGFRLFRSMTLGLAVLRDGIMVSRALSMGRERIPAHDIGSAACRRWWRWGEIVIYRRNRFYAPVISGTGFMSGYRPDDWQELRDSLRQLLEPLGKWQDVPWWRPLFPF